MDDKTVVEEWLRIEFCQKNDNYERWFITANGKKLSHIIRDRWFDVKMDDGFEFTDCVIVVDEETEEYDRDDDDPFGHSSGMRGRIFERAFAITHGVRIELKKGLSVRPVSKKRDRELRKNNLLKVIDEQKKQLSELGLLLAQLEKEIAEME
jgi:hypothetical protein